MLKRSKKTIIFLLGMCLMLSGVLSYSSKNSIAADNSPVAKVLGATIRQEATADGTQDIRFAIQVENASNAEMCGIVIGLNKDGTQKTKTISTDNIQYRKIYGKYENLDIVVYTVVVTDIPQSYWDADFTFKGIVRKLGATEGFVDSAVSGGVDSTYVSDAATRTVNGVKEAADSIEPIAVKKVNLAEDNCLKGKDKGTTQYVYNDSDSSASITYRYDGIVAYYINEDHSPVNLDDYSKIVLNMECPEVGKTITPTVGFGINVSNSSMNNTIISQGKITVTNNCADFTIDESMWESLSGDNRNQNTIAIKRGYGSQLIKINSITLYKKTSAPAEPTTAPTATPVPTETPEPTPDSGNITVALSQNNEYIKRNDCIATYSDNGVTLELATDNSGAGVAYYINSEKSSVNLSEYDIVFNITSDESWPILFAAINNDNTDYWTVCNGNHIKDVYTNINSGTHNYTYSDWSGDAKSLFIKYNTYNSDTTEKAKFTINSIKLVKKTA